MILLMTALPAMAAPGQVVVDTVDRLPLGMLETLGDSAGITDLHWLDANEGIAVGFADDVESSVAFLDNSNLVETAEEDLVIRIPENELPTLVASDVSTGYSVNDPDFAKQWHMRDPSIDAEWVWKNTTSGSGVVVAVLDTGYTQTKDFNPAQILEGKSFIAGQTIDDYHGHGTHCSATILEWTNNSYGVTGLANAVTLLPVKVLSDSGSGTLSGIVAGMYWAADQGADVVSMSLGGPSHSASIAKAIRDLSEAGVVTVVAAGNENSNRFGSPGDVEEAITVGAIGPTGVRAYYSNYGAMVDVFAPGGDKKHTDGGVFQITSSRGVEGLYEWQGTSMATPHVAAAAAVLLGEGACKDHKIRQNCIDTLLKKTATPKKGDKSDEYGSGIINLRKAVETRGSAVVADTQTLPYPSPAGNLIYVIAAMSALLAWTLSNTFHTSNRFAAVLVGCALATSGSLYGLTALPWNTHALSMFMVPWLEFPEYIIGPGASGFPGWLCFLPLLPGFIIMTPFRLTRGLIIGACLSAAVYFTLDTVFLFNPVWFISDFGDRIWLGLNALICFGMALVALDFHTRPDTK